MEDESETIFFGQEEERFGSRYYASGYRGSLSRDSLQRRRSPIQRFRDELVKSFEKWKSVTGVENLADEAVRIDDVVSMNTDLLSAVILFAKEYDVTVDNLSQQFTTKNLKPYLDHLVSGKKDINDLKITYRQSMLRYLFKYLSSQFGT